ncbi:MAG: Hsp20 family protein, partial [Bdellovibrionota bacterium]
SELKEQRTDFAQKYDKEGQTFKDSLTNQKQTYLKELYKQKRELDARAGLQSSRKDDPFYQTKGFDAALEETDNAYRLTAKVAPYEKDTVSIKVKDDKVTLSAKRGFEDRVEDKGVRVSTNTFQTYRQEFQLGAPADAKGVSKFVHEDGTINVIIPKKNFAPKI